MARTFSSSSGYGKAILAGAMASIFCTGPARADDGAVKRFAAVDMPATADCASSRTVTDNRSICAKASPVPAVVTQAPPARITVGRAIDLSDQQPVHFLSSASLDQSQAYIMSSSGRLRDTVRLISPPSAKGGVGDAPKGMPVHWSGLTSRFGMRLNPILNEVRLHAGIDLRAVMGEPVHATSGGVVLSAGWQGGYGLAVRIDHGKGIETRYAHLSRLNVAPGQSVKPGEVIGYVGSTGRSTGPHLHYEVRRNGQPVDPSSTLGK